MIARDVEVGPGRHPHLAETWREGARDYDPLAFRGCPGFVAYERLDGRDAVQFGEGLPQLAESRAEGVDVGIDEAGQYGAAFQIHHSRLLTLFLL